MRLSLLYEYILYSMAIPILKQNKSLDRPTVPKRLSREKSLSTVNVNTNYPLHVCNRMCYDALLYVSVGFLE